MKTKGWQKIFRFTFIQHIKTKSFIVGTIIVCLLTALMVAGVNVLPKLLSDEEEVISGSSSELTYPDTVYIYDNCEIMVPQDLTSLRNAGINVQQTRFNITEMTDKLAESTESAAMVLIDEATQDGFVLGYNVKTYYSPETPSEAVDGVTTAIYQMVDYRNMMNAGVSPENYAATQRYITTSKVTAGADEWNIFESAINYFVPIVVSLVLFMLIFVYGQTVAQSIATEKTSRVMELLLTSVRPLAVVIGKVLAMGLVSICQFILICLVGGGTFFATASFGIGGEIMALMNNAENLVGENAEIAEAINNTIGSITPLTIILVLVIFILGFLFFALIAALAGASISRMEDLQQAMQPLSFLGIVGVYLAYFPVIFNIDSMETGAASINPVQIFSYYFPVSSPFALPSALLLGTLSTIEVVIAIAILAVFVVLIAIVVAKVYEAIILHNGNRIKMTDIFKMALRK
ncbi:MAG: ABC transporter permease [Oscillospiraceae bacterium]|nr:ABC transporter permease [Oscillospiraceae bacterium]